MSPSPEAGPLRQYEYLDHTADVQLHAWGATFSNAVEQVVTAFYGYHTADLSSVQELYSMDFRGQGHDREAMLHSLLEECLYLFDTEPFFIGRRVEVLQSDVRESACEILVRAFGESFDKKKHPPGTAVKAITYSSMQIHDNIDGQVHIYVIVDI